MPFGNAALAAPTPHHAMRSPDAAAANASITLSVSSDAERRLREAPREVRMASSRVRPAARLRSRFATFAHAINMTSATAARTSSIQPCTEPKSASRSERTTARAPSIRLGPGGTMALRMAFA
jgi:hypothetical protein